MSKFITYISIMILLAIVVLPYVATAEFQIHLLTDIGDFVTDESAQDLGLYINAIVRLAVSIATGLAVIMLVIGGITYMITGSLSQKANAKEMINAALFGLVLALASFLILQTINPALVRLDFIETLKSFGETIEGQIEADGSVVDDAAETALRARLEELGVIVNNPPCAPGQTSGCTNLVGLPASTINNLVFLAAACNCTITVTGGSEGGHAEHGVGEPVVDLTGGNTSLNNLITRGAGIGGLIGGETFVLAGVTYRWEPLGWGNSTGNHWHAVGP